MQSMIRTHVRNTQCISCVLKEPHVHCTDFHSELCHESRMNTERRFGAVCSYAFQPTGPETFENEASSVMVQATAICTKR